MCEIRSRLVFQDTNTLRTPVAALSGKKTQVCICVCGLIEDIFQFSQSRIALVLCVNIITPRRPYVPFQKGTPTTVNV